MIQLQHLNINGQHSGGLYVRPKDIAAVYSVFNEDDEKYETYIVLTCGKEFRVSKRICDLLEILNKF